jgi:antitoxin PrlF
MHDIRRESRNSYLDYMSRNSYYEGMKPAALVKGRLRPQVPRARASFKHSDTAAEPGPREGNMKATVSEKGQITIPKKLRDRLGIRPGQVLEWTENQGKLVGRKLNSADDDPLRRVYGILKIGGSTDEWIKEIRGEPDAL